MSLLNDVPHIDLSSDVPFYERGDVRATITEVVDGVPVASITAPALFDSPLVIQCGNKEEMKNLVLVLLALSPNE